MQKFAVDSADNDIPQENARKLGVVADELFLSWI